MSNELSPFASTICETGATLALATPSTYHVFLSFRGPDTRDGFADWLYNELEASGIRTFRDDDEIQRGENIDREIEKAIKESQVGLIVFSEDFASSPYCLDEVVMLMERRKIEGIAVIPVFFKVDPSSVSNQTGSFEVSFEQHEKKLPGLTRKDLENERRRLDRWKEALREAADLGGMVYQSGYQSLFIRSVVKEVARQVDFMPLCVPSFVVGIDRQLKVITSWMQRGSTCPSMALIYGIGGVGKTTIAKLAYNHNFKRFERSCFLAKVREASEQSSGLVVLQKQLLTRVQRGGTHDFHDPEEGSLRIRDAICRKRVLIVIDDVDQSDHLKAIIGGQDWVYPGSKIIITTRNRGLLEPWEPVLSVGVLPWFDESISLQLFSWHAFRQPHPVEAYMNISKRAVGLCCGLPLALKVLGSSLRCRSIASWDSILQKVEIGTLIKDDKVKKVLRISYESLRDDLDKALFLDVACFFIGMNKEYVQKILESCRMYGCSGDSLKRLVDRCLVAVDENDELTMHPLIRDMGRDIVSCESSNPGERSRIWSHQDAFSVLQKNNSTGIIRTFRLDKEQMELPPEPSGLHLRAEALSGMHNLKFLHLKNTRFEGDFDGFPKSLHWLSWHGFPLSSIPINVLSDDLVVLDLQYSCLQVYREESMILKNLKILNLSHSNSLFVTPDFEGLPSLEILVLAYCVNLVKIHESIGLLKQLSSLDLTGCRNLKRLPSEIANSKLLKELILGGCFELCQVQTIQEGSSLPAMQTRLSFSVLLTSLVKLSLENCNICDDNILHDLSVLSSLEHLDLSFNPISTLPECILRLASLRSLWLMGCEELHSLPQLPPSLLDLIVVNCRSLQRIASFPTSDARRLVAVGCENLVEVGDMFKIREIQSTDSEMINELHYVELKSTEYMKLKWFHNMTKRTKWTTNQVLHEFGIFSVFLPGSRIPTEYIYQSPGCLLRFKVPGHTQAEVIGLNLCVLYKEADAEGRPPEMPSVPFQVVIWNIHGRREWSYCPTAHVVSHELPVRDGGVTVQNDAKLLWLSRWNLRGQLWRGDLVAVVVFSPYDIEVERYGISLFYEKEADHRDIAIVTSTHTHTSGKLTVHPLVHFSTVPTIILDRDPEIRLTKILCGRGLVFFLLFYAWSHTFDLEKAISSLIIEDACNVVPRRIFLLYVQFAECILAMGITCLVLWLFLVKVRRDEMAMAFSWIFQGLEIFWWTRSGTSGRLSPHWVIRRPIDEGSPKEPVVLKIRDLFIIIPGFLVYVLLYVAYIFHANTVLFPLINGAQKVVWCDGIWKAAFEVALLRLVPVLALVILPLSWVSLFGCPIKPRYLDGPGCLDTRYSMSGKEEDNWERHYLRMVEKHKRSSNHGKHEEEELQRLGNDASSSQRVTGLIQDGKFKMD